MHDRAMVTMAAGTDKYRNASRDITKRHGYTMSHAIACFAQCSMSGYLNGYEKRLRSGTAQGFAAGPANMPLCYLTTSTAH
jgi:hypothetical protein